MSKLEMVVEARVEEAVETMPLVKRRVVDVACSLVESLVQFQGTEGQADLQSLEIQTLVVAKSVVVALVPVALRNVKFCKVVEARARN